MIYFLQLAGLQAKLSFFYIYTHLPSLPQIPCFSIIVLNYRFPPVTLSKNIPSIRNFVPQSILFGKLFKMKKQILIYKKFF